MITDSENYKLRDFENDVLSAKAASPKELLRETEKLVSDNPKFKKLQADVAAEFGVPIIVRADKYFVSLVSENEVIEAVTIAKIGWKVEQHSGKRRYLFWVHPFRGNLRDKSVIEIVTKLIGGKQL